MNKSVFSQTNYTLRKTFYFFETEMQVRIQKLRPLSLSFFRLKYGNGAEIKGRFLNNLDFAIQSRVCGQFTLDMTMKNEEKFKALNINHEKFTHNLLNLNVVVCNLFFAFYPGFLRSDVPWVHPPHLAD